MCFFCIQIAWSTRSYFNAVGFCQRINRNPSCAIALVQMLLLLLVAAAGADDDEKRKNNFPSGMLQVHDR